RGGTANGEERSDTRHRGSGARSGQVEPAGRALPAGRGPRGARRRARAPALERHLAIGGGRGGGPRAAPPGPAAVAPPGGGGAGGEVAVGFVVGRARATVRVRDHGGADPGARPVTAPEPPPPAADRGRGAVLMHGLAERVVIREHSPGTEVRMEFAAGRVPA